MKEKRFEELMAEMNKSFCKENYLKSEIEQELRTLQSDMGRLTFNSDHAVAASLRIWDVVKHLEQMNEECGHVAEEQLAKFKEASNSFCNHIKREISGNAGESKAFQKLEHLETPNKMIKNVELGEGEEHTELDVVVITPKGVTIVEVKNPKKNIFIDEDGDYYRIGEYSRRDCNIAEKMAKRERLLRKVLEDAGYGQLRIKSILVFTNNRIEVHNKHAQIENCFLSQLTYMIDDDRAEDILSGEDIEKLQKAVEDAGCSRAYPFEFDVQQYKEDFAELMVMLEFAKAGEETALEAFVLEESVSEETAVESSTEAVEVKKASFADMVRAVMASRTFRYVGGAAAALAVTVVSRVVAESVLRGKGGF